MLNPEAEAFTPAILHGETQKVEIDAGSAYCTDEVVEIQSLNNGIRTCETCDRLEGLLANERVSEINQWTFPISFNYCSEK